MITVIILHYLLLFGCDEEVYIIMLPCVYLRLMLITIQAKSPYLVMQSQSPWKQTLRLKVRLHSTKPIWKCDSALNWHPNELHTNCEEVLTLKESEHFSLFISLFNTKCTLKLFGDIAFVRSVWVYLYLCTVTTFRFRSRLHSSIVIVKTTSLIDGFLRIIMLHPPYPKMAMLTSKQQLTLKTRARCIISIVLL